MTHDASHARTTHVEVDVGVLVLDAVRVCEDVEVVEEVEVPERVELAVLVIESVALDVRDDVEDGVREAVTVLVFVNDCDRVDVAEAVIDRVDVVKDVDVAATRTPKAGCEIT